MALQNLIKLRRSSVPGKTPLTTDLSLGELAINTNDGKMFMKKDDGAESIVEVLSELTGLQLSGGTLTGFLTLHADPTSALHAATKQYVDNNSGPGANPIRDEFVESTDFTEGVTTQLTLSTTPSDTDGVFIFFDGGYQQADAYSIATNVVTFTSAIPVGVQRVEVLYGTPLSGSTALLDVAQQFTAQHGFTTATLSDGANISWDLNNAQVAEVTLGGNRTLDNPTNQVEGTTYILFVKQDGTGSRTLGFGDAYYWEGDVAPTLSTGANVTDVLVFVSDGTRMLGQYSLNYSEAPTGTLVDAVASACGDLDATKSDSYSGSGETWANIITAPADGSLQADYDFWLGTDGTASDNPVFTGSAGDAAAYFNWDASNRIMQMKSAPTLMDQSHSDNGNDWWIAIAFQAQTGTTSEFAVPFCTGGDGSGAAFHGFEVLISQPGNIFGIDTRINWNRNDTRVVNDLVTGEYTNGNDYLLIISFDSSTDNVTVWKNTTTGVTDADINSATGTSSAEHSPRIGNRDPASGASALKSGTRMYHMSFGNEYLDDTKAGLIKSHLEARHSRTYNAV